MLLAIEWGSLAAKTGQFILSFSILVVLHELGHFIPARLFKCRVEKFYLFFNPWFSLWKKQKGETEYGIGWIPFGGYVKISGMIDESMDKEQLQLPPQPYEFRSKPAWQRLIIMLGGVIVNVILAIIIFIGITWVWGEEYVSPKNVKYGLYADSLASKIGIQNGDNIVSIDGNAVENVGNVGPDIILKEAKNLQVMRNGTLITLQIPADFAKNLNKSKLEGFIGLRWPTVVEKVNPDAVITKGQLLPGDTLVGLNTYRFSYYNEFAVVRDRFKDSIVTLTVLRGNDTATLKCFLKNGKVGFAPVSPEKLLGTTVKQYSLLQSVPLGFAKCATTLGNYVTGLKRIFTGKDKASDSLGSVISIGNTFPPVWDWQRFWTLTGIFSIILAFMNVLPIPALDGGHALFTLVEMITGRKPSDKFMEYAQTVGMVLLLGLMAYALGLDFWRLFK